MKNFLLYMLLYSTSTGLKSSERLMPFVPCDNLLILQAPNENISTLGLFGTARILITQPLILLDHIVSVSARGLGTI